MSASYALKTARALGIRVRLGGDDLELEASLPPPSTVLDLLSRHKVEILRLLRPANESWSPEDWQVFFDERAGVAEFDGGLSRAEAERRAFASCVTAWLNSNPGSSAPGRCLDCGGGERSGDPLLPFGTETTGHTWLHRACWPTWCQAREAEAIAALLVMGIRAPIISHETNNSMKPKQGEKA
jgi:hypothetical protein